jgi:uncharacterized protein (DUF934 family)
MALIRDRELVRDSWLLLDSTEPGAAQAIAADGDLIVPLNTWRECREGLLRRSGRLGVWLTGADDPALIASDLHHLQVIAIHFTSFTDGRGYSIARLLRERFGWRGELRAVGDIQRDQIYYLHRVGFDAFDLREGEDAQEAIAALKDFTHAYQAAADIRVPLFRRREAVGQS